MTTTTHAECLVPGNHLMAGLLGTRDAYRRATFRATGDATDVVASAEPVYSSESTIPAAPAISSRIGAKGIRSHIHDPAWPRGQGPTAVLGHVRVARPFNPRLRCL